MILKRLRNLWRISAIELPRVADTKTLQEKLKEAILGHKKASIVDLTEPIDIFEDETN